MIRTIPTAGLVLAALVAVTGCTTQIAGRARLLTVDGAPLKEQEPAGVTVNFINLDGRIEDSLLSVRTDAKGKFRSPELTPGEYAVEAMLPGFAIGKATVTVKNRQHKRANFKLRKIREARGRSMREAEDENIPHAGEVQIGLP